MPMMIDRYDFFGSQQIEENQINPMPSGTQLKDCRVLEFEFCFCDALSYSSSHIYSLIYIPFQKMNQPFVQRKCNRRGQQADYVLHEYLGAPMTRDSPYHPQHPVRLLDCFIRPRRFCDSPSVLDLDREEPVDFGLSTPERRSFSSGSYL